MYIHTYMSLPSWLKTRGISADVDEPRMEHSRCSLTAHGQTTND